MPKVKTHTKLKPTTNISQIQNILSKDQHDSSSNNYSSFASFQLPQTLQKALKLSKLKTPTEIQQKSIPIILQGKSAIVMSRTGSGKTLAFLIPMLVRLMRSSSSQEENTASTQSPSIFGHSKVVGTRSLIISPTRELALQTYRVLNNLIKKSNFGSEEPLRVAAILGGDPLNSHFAALAQNPDIIVATPGRLIHILDLVNSFSLSRVDYLVFDEADRLFEQGFKPQIELILRNVTNRSSRQVILCSATLPKAVAEFAQVGLDDPEIIRLDVEQKLPPHLKLAFFNTKSHERMATFLYIVQELVPKDESTVIFVATRHHAELLNMILKRYGWNPAMIYGKMDFEARKAELEDFHQGRKSLLVVTDVAARGIDIPELNNVINFHFPAQPKLFLHRVGRAARAGRKGVAYSIVALEDMPYMVDLLMFLKKPFACIDGKVHLNNDGAASDEMEDVVLEGLTDEEKSNLREQQDSFTTLSTYDGYFGSIPGHILQTEIDSILKLLEEDTTIQSQYETSQRGYKLYKKTRASAPMTAATKSKEILSKITDIPYHPLILGKLGSGESSQFKENQSLVRSVTHYKPSFTVFEVVEGTNQYDMMQKLRKEKAFQNHFKPSNFKKQTESESKSTQPKTLAEKLLSKAQERPTTSAVDYIQHSLRGRFKNSEYFMEYDNDQSNDDDRHYMVDQSGYSNINQHVFGVTGEDQEDYQKEKRMLVWDSKKRNYVYRHLMAGQKLDTNKRVKNEAGVLVNKDDLDRSIYTKWRRNTAARIQSVGETEEDFKLDSIKIYTRSERWKKAVDKQQEANSTAKSNGKNEVKSEEQVKKLRKQQKKDAYTQEVFEKVKVLGKRKVQEQLSRQGMEKKLKLMHKEQNDRKLKRKASAYNRRMNRNKK